MCSITCWIHTSCNFHSTISVIISWKIIGSLYCCSSSPWNKIPYSYSFLTYWLNCSILCLFIGIVSICRNCSSCYPSFKTSNIETTIIFYTFIHGNTFSSSCCAIATIRLSWRTCSSCVSCFS